MSKKIKIVKYHSCRKYWDFNAQKSLSLGKICDMVKAGDEIEVRSSKNETFPDITTETLVRVLLEGGKLNRTSLILRKKLIYLIKNYVK